MNCACGNSGERGRPKLGRVVREASVWAIIATLWAVIPKCPACLAVYIAVWTGLGMSFTMASWVRTAAMILAGAVLLYLIATRLRRLLGIVSRRIVPER